MSEDALFLKASRQLHELWTWAVGLPGYEKPKWRELEAAIEKLATSHRVVDALRNISFNVVDPSIDRESIRNIAENALAELGAKGAARSDRAPPEPVAEKKETEPPARKLHGERFVCGTCEGSGHVGYEAEAMLRDKKPVPVSWADVRARDARLALLKEARRRIRDIDVKKSHAYVLGVAVGVLYGMRDEIRAELGEKVRWAR